MQALEEKANAIYELCDTIRDNKMLSDIDRDLLREKIKEIYLILKDIDEYKANKCIDAWNKIKTIQHLDLSGQWEEQTLVEVKSYISQATGVRITYKDKFADEMAKRLFDSFNNITIKQEIEKPKQEEQPKEQNDNGLFVKQAGE